MTTALNIILSLVLIAATCSAIKVEEKEEEISPKYDDPEGSPIILMPKEEQEKLKLFDEVQLLDEIYYIIKNNPESSHNQIIDDPSPQSYEQNYYPEENYVRDTRNLEYYQPQPYSFSYGVDDEYSGSNYQSQEYSDGNTVTGSYSIHLPDGRIQQVDYVANENGYQAHVSYKGEAKYPPEDYNKQQQQLYRYY